ncbi:MAG TPA: efflux RND transporter periplasmic adaptor subunit [Terriglobales bacterium]|nr:efflux RND transporter periplasmic adaptor subunit [Terriglobales bacterium]
MKKLPTIGALALALFWASACSGSGAAPNDPSASPRDKDVPVTKVSSQKVPVYIEATGTVQPDLDGGARILSPVAGAVSRIFVRIGDGVREGQPLIAVRSPEISDAYASYLSATSQVQQAERIYRLNEKLLDVGAVTRNDFLTSEASYEQLKASAEGLRRKLDLYGVAPADGFTDEMVLKSPIDGCAADISVHIGDRFEASASLAYVLSPDKIVIVANLYDTDIGKIRAGENVTFTTDVAPGAVFGGRVSYVSGAEDPDAKTVRTFIRLTRRQDLFRQNMFLKIKILESEQMMPVVSKTCLLYKDGQFFVFVRRNGTFERQAVTLLHEVSETQVALSGLRDGDEIATSAIDLERS